MASVHEALACVHDLAECLDVMVVDLRLNDGFGGEVVRAYRQLGCCCGVLVCSGMDAAEAARAARRIGADDFLPKSAIDLLLTRVHAAAARARDRRCWGETERAPVADFDSEPEDWLATQFLPALQRSGKLTDRQVEVLRMVLQGSDRTYIAEKLGISYDTIRNHIRNSRERLGAESMADLIRIYALVENRRRTDQLVLARHADSRTPVEVNG